MHRSPAGHDSVNDTLVFCHAKRRLRGEIPRRRHRYTFYIHFKTILPEIARAEKISADEVSFFFGDDDRLFKVGALGGGEQF